MPHMPRWPPHGMAPLCQACWRILAGMCVAQMPNWSREVLQDVLSDALSQAWTPAQEAVLSNEAGMETVIDAVGRVNAAAQVLSWLVCCKLSSTFFDSHVYHLENSGVVHAMVLTKAHLESHLSHGHMLQGAICMAMSASTCWHFISLACTVMQCTSVALLTSASQICHSHALPCT